MNTASHWEIGNSLPGGAYSARRVAADPGSARRLYFLDFPLLLLSVGLLTWIIPTDIMLLVSSLTGAFAGLYTMWEIAIRRKPIRFSHIYCFATTVGYGLGTANSWLSISRGHLSLAEFFNRDTVAVSQAMAAVLIASGILYSLGELFEPPVFPQNFSVRLDNRAFLFVLSSTGLVIGGYLTGQLGYMGSTAASSNGGHIGFVGGLISWLFPTSFALACLCLLEWRKGIMKWCFGVMLAVQFVLTIPTGRRSLVYFVLLAIITMRFSSFRPKLSLPRKVVYAAILISVVMVGVTAFYYLRYAAQGQKKASLADRISLAMALYESGNTAKANQGLKENLQRRTFVLGYVSDLLDASFRMTPAHGQNALHEFQLAVPSALWPGKSSIIYQEETLANTTYNFSYKDEANSLYSAGAIDFGIWGMIIYPIIVCALYRIIAEVALTQMPNIVATLVILFLLHNALLTEAGLVSDFVSMRDAMVYMAFLWVFFKIPEFSSNRRPENAVLLR